MPKIDVTDNYVKQKDETRPPGCMGCEFFWKDADKGPCFIDDISVCKYNKTMMDKINSEKQ